MSENCHNSGKIYWSLLAESLSYKIYRKNPKINYDEDYKWSIDNNKLEHFSNVMAAVIKDFAETYKKEDRYELNPTKWKNAICTSSGGQTSYADSLIAVYVCLNLILLNSKLNETPLLKDFWGDACFLNGASWVYDICSGRGDYVQEKYLVSKFIKIRKKLFERYTEDNCNFQNRIKLWTTELVEEIRDYLKEVFECLIRIYQSEEYKYRVDSEHISDAIRWCLVNT